MVMGVSGSGKSRGGQMVAKDLGWSFIEADGCIRLERCQDATARSLDRQPAGDAGRAGEWSEHACD
jgi:gluconate kinase